SAGRRSSGWPRPGGRRGTGAGRPTDPARRSPGRAWCRSGAARWCRRAGRARPAARPGRCRWRTRNGPAPGRPVRTAASCAGSSRRTTPSARRNGPAWECLPDGGRRLPAWLDATRWGRARGALTERRLTPTLRVLRDARADPPHAARGPPPSPVSEHDALDAQGGHDLARDLLDRHVGGAEHRDALGAEQLLGRRHLALAGLQARVARVGPAFLADLVQAHRVDGQAEQLGAVRTQPRRQPVVLEVLV